MTVGERIKNARIKKGYSQTELAELMGYKSRSSINKIEVEGRDIPRSSVVKLAKILDVTPAYLVGWESAPSQEDSEPDFTISPKEKMVVTAYRDTDDKTREHVDLLLRIEDDAKAKGNLGFPNLDGVKVEINPAAATRLGIRNLGSKETGKDDIMLDKPAAKNR